MEAISWRGAKVIGIQIVIILMMMLVASCGGGEEKDSEKKYGYGGMWPARQRLWYFNNPRGIVTDRSGHVFLADTRNHCIKKFTMDGHFITQWGSLGSKDGQFNHVTALAVDESGNIYAVDRGNHRIQKFTTHGRYLTQWGRKGDSNGRFKFPDGIAVDDKGFVYVADTDNHRIQKFNSDGQFEMKWGKWGDDKGEFRSPVSIVVDHQGNLLVADLLNHRIQKFSDKGDYLPGWEPYGDKVFKRPVSLALDSSGNVYVADSAERKVKIFSPGGQLIGSWKDWTLREDKTIAPGVFFISFGPQDMAYLADTTSSRILKLTSSGEFISEWASSGTGQGEFHRPGDVAIHPQGRLFAVDTNNHRIQAINLKDKEQDKGIRAWGGPGDDKGQFASPQGISIDSKGNVYVADTGNHRIQKIDPKGDIIAWGGRGDDKGQFSFPRGVAVDAENMVYVADTQNHRIQIFNAEGKYISLWEGKEAEKVRFNQPTGIEICSDGNVYVVDSGNARIVYISSKGKVIDERWGSDKEKGVQFKNPQKIALDKKGNVYVTDAGSSRVHKFNSKGELQETFGANGNLPGKMNSPHGIAVNGTGTRLFVADTHNDRIQLFQRVPKTPDTKSIVVAGRGSSAGDSLWDATQFCANSAYLTLMHRRFSADDIYYLSSDININPAVSFNDGNVDAEATNQNLEQAITAWAADTENLVLYLVDHGGEGVFRMNGSQLLNAADLDTWLDRLQSGTSGNVTVVYDACESGSFLNALTPEEDENRVVITSTSTDENATFASQGTVSYSSFFWLDVFSGEDIKSSHESAGKAMSLTTKHQNALLDANGNAIGNENQDLALVDGKYIGQGIGQPGAWPIIGEISPNQEIKYTSTAQLYAEKVTTQTGSIARVWAIIRPPDFQLATADNALLELPAIDLLPVGNDRYEVRYNGFHTEGNYQVLIFARDSFGNTSEAYETLVRVGDPLRRRAIIVAGAPGGPMQATVQNLTEMASKVLDQRGYNDVDISFLSSATGSITLGHLKDAITFQTTRNVLDVVIYMVGSGDVENFQMSATETLTATGLDEMLDDLQNSFAGEVVVVYDGSHSGSFLNKLTPPAGRTRILIASTDSNQDASFISDGDISFSSFFWLQVLYGANVRDAFVNAMNAIGYAGGGQTPMLDDSGNGVGNEPGTDGRLARDFVIGAGIDIAGSVPVADSVSADQILTGGNVSAIIQVRNVTTTNSIERVWAVITPPEFDALQSNGLTTDHMELTPVGDNYQGDYDKFNLFGIYHIGVFAKDVNGGISLLKTTTVEQTEGPDSYEVDDTPAEATEFNLISGVPQRHNFHDVDDLDWVRFEGYEGEVIEIKVRRVGSHADVVIEIYGSDGTTPIGGSWNWGGAGEDETITFVPPQTDKYYVKTRQPSGHFPGPDTGYDLEIFRPIGGFLRVRVKDRFTKNPIPDVEISIFSNVLGSTSDQGDYLTQYNDGKYLVGAKKDGYVEASQWADIPMFGTEDVAFELTPIRLQGPFLLLLLP